MPSHRLDPEDLADFDHLVPDFITVTATLDDPRVRGRTTHSLTTILFVCVSAAMAGAKSVHAYGHFAEASWAWVRSCLGPEVGAEPVSHDTIGRLLQKMRPTICEELLAELVRRRTDRRPEDQIAIDGKRLAATAQRSLANVPLASGGQQAFTTVSALGVDSGLVVACHTSTEPGSEHACVAQVLDTIDLRGAVVTMDAGNAYAKFAERITSGGGEYLLCLKGNNARSVELCQQMFDGGVEREYAESETVDAARGDRRGVRVAKLDGAREAGHGTGACDRELLDRWGGAVCVVEVERERRSRTGQCGANGKPKRSWHAVYYVCSTYLAASDAQRYIRSHWDVENRLHWTLDVSYGEDASRARSGYLAQNLATVRRLANNVLAAFTKSSSKLKHQMKFALDAKWRDQVWGLV